MIKMNGNNPMFWQKLHNIINISVNSKQICLQPLQNGGYIFKMILVQKCQKSLVTPNDGLVSSKQFGKYYWSKQFGKYFWAFGKYCWLLAFLALALNIKYHTFFSQQVLFLAKNEFAIGKLIAVCFICNVRHVCLIYMIKNCPVTTRQTRK